MLKLKGFTEWIRNLGKGFKDEYSDNEQLRIEDTKDYTENMEDVDCANFGANLSKIKETVDRKKAKKNRNDNKNSNEIDCENREITEKEPNKNNREIEIE